MRNRPIWVTTLGIVALLLTVTGVPPALAAGGALKSPEVRALIRGLSREERRTFRSLSRAERRAFIKTRLAGSAASGAVAEQSGGATDADGSAASTQGADLWPGPIIDAHSQVDPDTDLDQIIERLDRAGVAQVILSTRFKQRSTDVLQLAQRFPARIVPAAKTKTKAFMKNKPRYREKFAKELRRHDFKAMAEIIMWHAAKKRVGAGRVAIQPDDPRVRFMMRQARDHKMPFIAHIEFADMGTGRDQYMAGFEALLAANRDVPVGLIHMGQLEARDVARLLAKHPNLFFITSHANPINASHSRLPWTEMFAGTELAPVWRELVIAHKDRFVLALDNVFHFHWEEMFQPQVEIWRKALAKLPVGVADAVAHGNAERIWGLRQARLD